MLLLQKTPQTRESKHVKKAKYSTRLKSIACLLVRLIPNQQVGLVQSMVNIHILITRSPSEYVIYLPLERNSHHSPTVSIILP